MLRACYLFKCIHLYFIHSSNGKSVSWSEPGGRQVQKGQHMWHRLSVHVKTKETGLSNQTAVIKPITKGYQVQNKSLTFSDTSTNTLYNVEEEDENEPARFNFPSSPSLVIHRRLATTPPPSQEYEEGSRYLPDQVSKSLPLQKTILDQLHGVINKFSTGIPDFNSIMPIPGPENRVDSIYPTQQVLPLQMAAYSEGIDCFTEEVENEKLNLIRGYMYDSTDTPDEDLVPNKLELEDSPALTPPSPFRDSVASGSSVPSSPVSESVLCTPPSVTYASVMLRDFKQTSSTL